MLLVRLSSPALDVARKCRSVRLWSLDLTIYVHAEISALHTAVITGESFAETSTRFARVTASDLDVHERTISDTAGEV